MSTTVLSQVVCVHSNPDSLNHGNLLPSRMPLIHSACSNTSHSRNETLTASSTPNPTRSLRKPFVQCLSWGAFISPNRSLADCQRPCTHKMETYSSTARLSAMDASEPPGPFCPSPCTLFGQSAFLAGSRTNRRHATRSRILSHTFA